METAPTLQARIRKILIPTLAALMTMTMVACGGAEEDAAETTDSVAGSTEDVATDATDGTSDDSADAGQNDEPPGELKEVRVVFGAGAVSPLLAGQTIGVPLGYYEEEGLDLNIVAAPGGGTSMQALAVGQAEYAIVVAAPYIGAEADSDLGIVDACNQTAQIHWQLWVRPDSEITSFEDLVGKRIGVISFGDSEYTGVRQTLQGRGLNPDEDVEFISVDQGAQAGTALESGEVDVLAMWDGAIATIRTLGYEMEQIPNPEEWENLFGFGFGVREEYLAENGDEVAGFCRAAAKGQVFAMTNPEDAVRLHWEVAPETRSEGSEEEALQASLAPLQARIQNWTPCGDITCEGEWRWGWHNPDHWEATLEFSGLADQIDDVHNLYTNELVEDINDFDAEAVVQQAESFDFDEFMAQ